MVFALDTGVVNFEAFIANYLDDVRYELIDGELIDWEPTNPHEQVTGLINRKLNVALDLLNLPWFIPMKCLIKPLGANSAFRPDLTILDQNESQNSLYAGLLLSSQDGGNFILVLHRSNQIHSPRYFHYLTLQLCWDFDGCFPINPPVLTSV